MEFFLLNAKDRDGQNAKLVQYHDHGYTVVGVEVTDSSFEKLLDLNFDPQHRDSEFTGAACEQVFEWLKTPQSAAWFDGSEWAVCTSKWDLDSLAGAALLWWRWLGRGWVNDPTERLAEIANGDSWRSGRWEEGKQVAAFSSELQTLMHACQKIQFQNPRQAVELLAQWLEFGSFEGQVQAAQELEVIREQALAVPVGTLYGDLIAYVESVLPFATSVAYCHAPVGVCFNPNFRGVEKYTICEWGDDLTRVDFKGLTEALNELEQTRWPYELRMIEDPETGFWAGESVSTAPTWGGQGKIIGSPFGVSSRLSTQEVLWLVELYTTHSHEWGTGY